MDLDVRIGGDPISHFHVKWKLVHVARKTLRLAGKCRPLKESNAICHVCVVQMEGSEHCGSYPGNFEGK